MKLLTSTPPAWELLQKAVMVSMARTAALVMGSRNGQVSSPVRRNLSQVYAMMASSVRGLVSPVNVSGSLGIPRSSLATVLVARAAEVSIGSGSLGAWSVTDPPVIKRKPVVLPILSGFTMVSQCFQMGLFTSAEVRHCWEVRSRT